MKTETLDGPATAVKRSGGLEGSAKWMALAAAVLGWMFDGLEMGIFPLVGRPALTEMLGGGDIGPWFGRIIAVFLVGAAFGGFALGWLGDRISAPKDFHSQLVNLRSQRFKGGERGIRRWQG